MSDLKKEEKSEEEEPVNEVKNAKVDGKESVVQRMLSEWRELERRVDKNEPILETVKKMGELVNGFQKLWEETPEKKELKIIKLEEELAEARERMKIMEEETNKLMKNIREYERKDGQVCSKIPNKEEAERCSSMESIRNSYDYLPDDEKDTIEMKHVYSDIEYEEEIVLVKVPWILEFKKLQREEKTKYVVTLKPKYLNYSPLWDGVVDMEGQFVDASDGVIAFHDPAPFKTPRCVPRHHQFVLRLLHHYSKVVNLEGQFVDASDPQNVIIEKAYDWISTKYDHCKMYTTFDSESTNISVHFSIKIDQLDGIRNLQKFDLLKEAPEFGNVVLVVDGKKLKANKTILAQYSTFFTKLFFGNFAESNQQEVELKDIVFEELVDLINVISPERKQITEKNIRYILKLADRFDMQAVLTYCEDFLMKDLDMDFVEKLVLAEKYQLIQLHDSCLHLPSAETIKSARWSDFFRDLKDSTFAALFVEAHKLLDD